MNDRHQAIFRTVPSVSGMWVSDLHTGKTFQVTRRAWRWVVIDPSGKAFRSVSLSRAVGRAVGWTGLSGSCPFCHRSRERDNPKCKAHLPR